MAQGQAHKMAAELVKGDRIATEYGNSTVLEVYPNRVRGSHVVLVQPDGYAATRTVEFPQYARRVDLLPVHDYAKSFPAMTGDVVTEGHVKHCARYGHAAWTTDGQDVGTCPRCGEVTLKPGELRSTADAPGEGDVIDEPSRPATEDEREVIDAVGANGLWSAEKGDSSHGDLFVAISFGDGSPDAVTYGYEENGYGQRCYYVFADDSAAQAWFDAIETGPAFS